MVPQARARDAQVRGQVSAYGDDGALPQAPGAGVPRNLSGAVVVAAYEQRRAYDRIVLGMDPAAAQCVPALAGPRVAPRASGLFGLLWC